jgi:predicted nuclease with TOPRIM domain
MIEVMENKKMTREQARKIAAEKDPYVGVLLEELKDQYKVLTEGQEAMEDRMDRFDTNLTRVEVKVDKLGIRMDNMEDKFDDLAVDVRQKADKKDVIALGHRVAKLETT